jgi:pyruvate-formate lyase-activating enzyme
MKLKRIVDEDFVNYKKISMFIASNTCNWKCCVEQGLDNSICQNSELAKSKTIDVPAGAIYRRYISNSISKCVVIGGLEPILQIDEVIDLIDTFRVNGVSDEFIIYTGYDRREIEEEVQNLKKYGNIIMKFGRYRQGFEKHFDEVLGIYLASDNQYGERIS